MSAVVEMFVIKMSELTTEAIPGLVLQTVAFLQTPEKTVVAVGSLMISALSRLPPKSTLYLA